MSGKELVLIWFFDMPKYMKIYENGSRPASIKFVLMKKHENDNFKR